MPNTSDHSARRVSDRIIVAPRSAGEAHQSVIVRFECAETKSGPIRAEPVIGPERLVLFLSSPSAAPPSHPSRSGVGMPDYVWAVHDFVPEHEDEIDFCSGDRIEILERDDQYSDGWWQVSPLFPGLHPEHGKASSFPCAMLRLYPEQPLRVQQRALPTRDPISTPTTLDLNSLRVFLPSCSLFSGLLKVALRLFRLLSENPLLVSRSTLPPSFLRTAFVHLPKPSAHTTPHGLRCSLSSLRQTCSLGMRQRLLLIGHSFMRSRACRPRARMIPPPRDPRNFVQC